MSKRGQVQPEELFPSKRTKIDDEQQALRYQAATLRCIAGWTGAAVARELGVSRKFVWQWAKRWEEGDRCLFDLGRAGRPVTATTEAIRKKVVAAHKGKRFKSSRQTASKLGISMDSVRRCLRREGLVPKRVQKVPKLSEKNIADRLRFTSKHKSTKWSKVMFTDEKDFWLFSRPHGKNDVVWMDKDDPPPAAPQMKYSPKLKVWGGITTHGKTKLIVYEGSLNAEQYKEQILKPAMPDIKRLLPNSSFIFQQDGATCHTAKTTQDFLRGQPFKFLPKEDWPGNSPDLNPIENVWARLAWMVAKRQPKDLADLKRFLKQEWNKMDDDYIGNYVKSMPRRIAAVEAAGGQYTKY